MSSLCHIIDQLQSAPSVRKLTPQNVKQIKGQHYVVVSQESFYAYESDMVAFHVEICRYWCGEVTWASL